METTRQKLRNENLLVATAMREIHRRTGENRASLDDIFEFIEANRNELEATVQRVKEFRKEFLAEMLEIKREELKAVEYAIAEAEKEG